MILRSISNANRRSRTAHGQALVPVILVVLILTLLAVAFTTSANREVKAASNFNAQSIRSYAAQGALNYAMCALASTSNNGWNYGIVPTPPDADANGWMQIGDAWVKMDVVDTGAMISLNGASATTLERITFFNQNPQVADAIVDWRTPETTATSDGAKSTYYQGLQPPYNCKDAPFDTVEELLLVEGMTPTILYGSPYGNGIDPNTAESNAQQTAAQQGNTTATAPSATSRAAGARSGITRQATTRPGGATGGATGGAGAGTGAGGTGNGGGTITGGTAQAGDTNWDDIYSVSTMPLSEMFTTLSAERNIASDGTPRVNINTASASALEAVGLSAAQANAIISYRGGATSTAPTGTGTTPTAPRPATNTRQARQGGGTAARPPAGGNTGNRPPNGNGTGARPGTGAGTGTGVGAGTGTGSTGQNFTSIASLLNVSGFTQTVMQQYADYLTTSTQQYNENLVNINTAPAEVLAAVPGMDHATLQAILAYRQGGGAFQTLGDFFTLQGLTRQEFQNVVGSICVKSSIYRIRIKVRTAGQQSISAVEAYVQMTDNGPQVIRYREVPRVPGWAYWVPSAVLPTPNPPVSQYSNQNTGN